jgi:hypothetical protein
MYTSPLSLTSVLDGGRRSKIHPTRFIPQKETRYPLYRKPDGPQGRSAWVRTFLSSPGFDPRMVQPVASFYTDWAIPTHDMEGQLGRKECWMDRTWTALKPGFLYSSTQMDTGLQPFPNNTGLVLWNTVICNQHLTISYTAVITRTSGLNTYALLRVRLLHTILTTNSISTNEIKRLAL